MKPKTASLAVIAVDIGKEVYHRRQGTKPTEPCGEGPRCDDSVETSLARS
jgi:hypothetical protein